MKRLIACFLLVLLAACGGAPPPKPAAYGTAGTAGTSGAPAQNAGPAAPRPKAPPKQVDAKPVAAPTKPVESAALPSEPKEPEIPVDDDPAQFMGSTDAALREALGRPALIRRDGDGAAEVWQFRGDVCTLDLFLYPADGGGFSVKHVELRGEGDDENRACLARMLRAQIIAADG